MNENSPFNKERESPEERRVERLLFGLSLVVILGVVAALLYLEFRPGPQGTLVTARVLEAQPQEDRLHVRYEVANHGKASVEDVTVTVQLGEEKVDQTMTHLPRGMAREGIVVFDRPARGARPEARVSSYLEP